MSNDQAPQASFAEQMRTLHPGEVQQALTAQNVEWDYASDAQKELAASYAARVNAASYMKLYRDQANQAEGLSVDVSATAPSIAERFAEEGVTGQQVREIADFFYDLPRGQSTVKAFQQELAKYEQNKAKGSTLFDNPCEPSGKRR